MIYIVSPLAVMFLLGFLAMSARFNNMKNDLVKLRNKYPEGNPMRSALDKILQR